jgi:hypothetical protein
MKANELRLGNFINDFEGKLCTVSGTTNGWIWSKGAYEPIPDNSYSPIPLTEEWLLKFGFMSNPYQDRYEKGPLYIECDKTRGYLILWIDMSTHSIDVEYVHQLQNLYFSLTGEEL